MPQTKYRTPKAIHVKVVKKYIAGLTRKEINDFLETKLGYIQQQKGGFWIEHRSFRKREYPDFY